MKISGTDVLAIAFVVAALILGIFILVIAGDPYSGLNPFPPPTLPATVFIPTASKTPLRFVNETPTPPGFTGVGTLRASSTGLPSPTGFVLPTATRTYTATPTDTLTPTITNTPTPSRTPSPTKVPPTATLNLTATYQVLATQISNNQTATSAVATVQSLSATQTQAARTPDAP